MQKGSGAPPPPQPSPPQGASAGEEKSGQRPGKWLTITDAMAYLDAVKLEFRDHPEIYDEFLAIMGRFRTKQMLPPEVIVEVARLFRGRNQLVLRFNRFLPEAYKIGQADIERMEEERMTQEAESRDRFGGDAGSPARDIGMRGGGRGAGVHDGGLLDDIGKGTPDNTDGEDDDDALDHEGPEEHEVDHAINYVTCIKRRFHDEPETYKAFLDILHTYQRQREHTGINTVLEQVTSLFADEPDLLKEFTYFLPDTVQAQAKEKLDRAAEEAEIRLGLRGANGRMHNGQRMPLNRSQGGNRGGDMESRGARGRMYRGGPAPRDGLEQDWHDQYGYRSSREGRAPRSGYRFGGQCINGDLGRGGMRHPYPGSDDGGDGSMERCRGGRRVDRWRGQEAEEYEGNNDVQSGGSRKHGRTGDYPVVRRLRRGGPAISSPDEFRVSPEHHFFDQARVVLRRDGDSTDWSSLLKVLEMFSNDVFSRDEMMVHVKDLFEGEDEYGLLQQFQALIDKRGSLDRPPSDPTPTKGLTEMNFDNAPVITPSYRELPRHYQLMRSSGRSAPEEKLLNDRWVSLPVGSEDNNTFKHMRRNPHEDVLFKVEDERFELDMLIDGVASTIARLEPAEEEIAALKATAQAALEQIAQRSSMTGESVASPSDPSSEMRTPHVPHFQYRLDERTLGAVHVSTVSRLYGEHGSEVIELMRKNPAATVPIVLKRLRQKEGEWRNARGKAKGGWKELLQKNFHRSLDHRSFHFRKEDRRSTNTRALLEEIKDKKAEEDPQKAAVVKAARDRVQAAQDDAALLLGRISSASTAAEADSVSAGQGSTGDGDASMADASNEGGVRVKSPETVPENCDDPTLASERPRSREGMRALRRQAEGSAPWYIFEHLSLPYPTEDVAFIHQDIIELLAHTLARRPPSEEDVRQASYLVTDLLPTFFGVGKPNSVGHDDTDGTGVSSGRVDSAKAMLVMPAFSSDDEDSDNESASANGKNEGKEDTGGNPLVQSSRSGESARSPIEGATDTVANDPGASLVPLPDKQEIFFTTTDFYLALRMHHMLAERLAAARRLCREAGSSRQPVVACPQEILQGSAGVEPSTSIIRAGKEETECGGESAEIGYKTFLGHLYDLLEEKISSDRYDEGVRQLVGNQGYVLGQLDKVVVGLLQNLYRASEDKVFSKLCELYHYERTSQPDGVVPATYRNDTEQLLRRSEKEVVRVQHHPGSKEATGNPAVKPTLKMEYIGPVNINGREESADGDRDSVPRTTAGGTESDAPAAPTE